MANKTAHFYLHHMTTVIGMFEGVKHRWHETDADTPLFTQLSEEAFDHALRAIHYAELAGFDGEYICSSQANFIKLIKNSKEYTNQCKWLEKHYAKRIKDEKDVA